MPSSTNAQSGVVVLGSLNMDLVVQVEHQPRPGDTVLGGDLATFPGGKGANQAAAAARAGGAVRMVGRVGSDAYGRQLGEALAALGIDTGAVPSHQGPSGVALITVDAAGENMIVVSPGANGRLASDELQAAHLEAAAVLLIQLEIPLETIIRAAALARHHGKVTILNAAPVQALPEPLLANLDVLIANEGEAELLSGVSRQDHDNLGDFAEAATAALLTRGPRAAVVTLGGEGLVWRDSSGTGRQPAHTVEVIDTTAAGDAFCGALAARLAEGAPLAEATRFANAAGALATTRLGAQPSLPDRPHIEALLAS